NGSAVPADEFITKAELYWLSVLDCKIIFTRSRSPLTGQTNAQDQPSRHCHRSNPDRDIRGLGLHDPSYAEHWSNKYPHRSDGADVGGKEFADRAMGRS